MASQPAPDAVISHWSTLVENFQASPLAFYDAVEAALKRREIPATENSRVDYKEGGLLSAKREYLHVVREKLVFDICGAPFGTGFFFSWWFADGKPQLHPALKLLALIGMVAIAVQVGLGQGRIAGILSIWPNRPFIAPVVLLAHGDALGLDRGKFAKCLDRGTAAKVIADLAEGQRLGVTGTPALFFGTVEKNGDVLSLGEPATLR